MREQIARYISSTTSDINDIWARGVIIFDTSALLYLYYFSKKSQTEIYNSTFEKLKGRLWIPGHVYYEYYKNREGTLKKPIDEKYNRLEKDVIQSLTSKLNEISGLINEFSNQTKQDENHPYLSDSSITESFVKTFRDFEKGFAGFKDNVEEEFSKRKDEIKAFSMNDSVLHNIEAYFKIGRSYCYADIMEIVKEGEIRYRNKIPPGFGDSKKEGIQKYGDLIIWKQIIEYAKQNKTPVILVTNDVKDDWCYKFKRSNEVRIIGPQEDLLRELLDEAGVGLLMYSFSQFLFNAKEILGTSIQKDVLEEAKTYSKPSVLPRFDGQYHTTFKGTSYIYTFFEDGAVLMEEEDTIDEEESTLGTYTIEGEKLFIRLGSIIYNVNLNGDRITFLWKGGEGKINKEHGIFVPFIELPDDEAFEDFDLDDLHEDIS